MTKQSREEVSPVDASNIERTAVVGGGLMGAGIAQIMAQAGHHVWVMDLEDRLLERCFQRVRDGLTTSVENGLLAVGQVAEVMSRVDGTTSLAEAIGDAQFVVEAVTENLAVKQDLFAKMSLVAPPETILATNTSGQSVTRIAERVRSPERVVGSHFFYPHTLIPLVEVGYGAHTSDATAQATAAFWQVCGKKPVICRVDLPGFLVNRMQSALAREAMSLVARGAATAEDVDTALRYGIGIRMPLWGPLEQRDWSGLDVHCAAAAATYPTLEDAKEPLPILVDKVARGETGVNAGKGFYDWTGKDVHAIWRKKQQQLIRLIQAVQQIVTTEEEDGK